MINSIQYFTRHLFDRDSTEDIELHEVENLLGKYPYFTPARFIRDQVLSRDQESIAGSGALFFNNHLWYEILLTRHHESDRPEASLLPVIVQEEVPIEVPPAEVSIRQEPAEQHIAQGPTHAHEVPTDDAPIAFEPYHTIDYFASQGIKLGANDLSKDKFGQQLKSFTEWIRSMKRLPAAESVVAADETGQQKVVMAAEHSIEGREVLTEAMAEVWVKQGNVAKAIEVYRKLSLMDSTKSSYFAAKIDELKST